MCLLLTGSMSAYANPSKPVEKTEKVEKAVSKAEKSAKKITSTKTEKTDKTDKTDESCNCDTNNKTPASKKADKSTSASSTDPKVETKVDTKTKAKAEKAEKVEKVNKTEKTSKKTDKSVNPKTEKVVEKTEKVNKKTESTPSKKYPTITKQAPDITSVYRLNFTTPSKNIICGGDVLPTYGGAKGVSCYVKKMDTLANIRKYKPASCRDKWGQVFELGKNSKSKIACYTDTPYSQKPQTLSYGQMVKGDGWHCSSSPEKGMKCVNRVGSGFEIGREKQSLF